MSNSKGILNPRSRESDPILRKIKFLDKMYQELDDKPKRAALIFRPPNLESRWDKPKARLIGDELIVGRRPNLPDQANVLTLAEAGSMSANHFRVHRVQDSYILSDDWPVQGGSRRGSRNGTFVNSDSDWKICYLLKEGDIIYAGGVLFSFIGD